MSSLIRGHRNGIGIFLYGCGNNFLNTTIVTQMNNLDTGSLNDTTHNIDRGIVAIEQGCGRYEP